MGNDRQPSDQPQQPPYGPHGPRRHDNHAPRPNRTLWIVLGSTAAAVVALAVAFAVTTTATAPPAAERTGPSEAAAPGERPSGGTTGKLPSATTYAKLSGLPRDKNPYGALDGTVVHPQRRVTVHAEPGGPAVATLPAQQLGGPTWVPVVKSRGGWDLVLLPSRPDGVTGWIRAGGLRRAVSHHRVAVDVSSRRMTITQGGRPLGRWTVAVGKRGTPTPTGRTFVLALLAPTKPTYSPYIIPLGTHSSTLETYGGGPGTVGFHGWRDASVFGRAASAGCVRVPQDALRILTRVPIGTPIQITA